MRHRTLALILMVWLLPFFEKHLALAENAPFFIRRDYPVGDCPGALVLGDFNNDGIVDIATANMGYETISVLLGNGDGTFREQRAYGIGFPPGLIIAEDFNRDGKLDLVVDRFLLLGDGEGGFTEQKPLDASGVSAVTGDFNNDGNPDLILGTSYPREILSLLGNGDGTFQDVLSTTIPHAVGGTTLCEDFDTDGNLDLLVTYGSAIDEYGQVYKAARVNIVTPYSHMALFFGCGDGTFQEGTELAVSIADRPYLPVIGDFNRDGYPDLFAAFYELKVLLGDGKGALGLAWELDRNYDYTMSDEEIFTMDVNHDAILDIGHLKRIAEYRYEISFMLGNGDGTFGERIVADTTGWGGSSVAVADLNADGKTDLVVANAGDDNVSVFLNKGIPSGIESNKEEEVMPGRYELNQNRPNPFNKGTVIPYRLAEPSTIALVVYDLSGQKVRTLVEGKMGAGEHRAVWDGKDEANRRVASGVYFFYLKGKAEDDAIIVKKLVILK